MIPTPLLGLSWPFDIVAGHVHAAPARPSHSPEASTELLNPDRRWAVAAYIGKAA